MLKNMFNTIFHWLPVVVVLISIFNFIMSYMLNNTAAMYANFVALLGWIAVATDEFTSKDSTD